MRLKLISTFPTTLLILIALSLVAGKASAWDSYKTLHRFGGGVDGGVPNANLVFDAQGNLYGTTMGSSKASSTVFKLTPNLDGTWTETVLYRPQHRQDPTNIRPGVILDSSGNLYGTSLQGGSHGIGTVYELVNNGDGSWTENTLHSFSGSNDGYWPVGGLIFDGVGNLYGTTVYGGKGNGVVFELSPGQNGEWTETVIYEFSGADGAYPDHGSLVFDASGNLYGVTAQGGKSGCAIWLPGCGVVFELSPDGNGTWTETVLYKFSGGNDGANPESTLIFDQSGTLYGTTLNGGSNKDGVIFRLIPGADNKWKFQVLHQFTGGTDGAHPYSGLIAGASGDFYGTTVNGGAGSCGGIGCGTVYQLAGKHCGKWVEQQLFRFKGTPAANPYGELIFDASGNLYGMDSASSTNGFGSVFELTP
jgi:uncharacterized repeat protein (TIGR03803 family)